MKRKMEGALAADLKFMKKDIRRGGPATCPPTRIIKWKEEGKAQLRPTYCQTRRKREGALAADPQFMKKDIRRGGPASWPPTRVYNEK